MKKIKEWFLHLVIWCTTLKFYIRLRNVPLSVVNHCIVFNGLKVRYVKSCHEYRNDPRYTQYTI